MAVPQSKGELLRAIDVGFEKLLRELADVPEQAVGNRNLEGHAKGTRMSVADLLAYLLGWNELVLKWLDRDAAGQPVDFPETGFKWNELGLLARKFYADHADTPYPLLLERLREAQQRIVAAVEARSDADLYGRPWYGKWTMGRMIQFNTSSPYENARGRLRTWKKGGGGD
ncbi:ClbS/DfsB family four-helix bundle protein [Sandaracinobacter sp. RS1-74]|uniref:ClbS/DfsB family four-helix bundle protein n=1 Tax=Sandaracinobacteroides sayramensis TaxID=2913411 RepID=UPI001EDAC256|nr:ClbS/DfsB family four-helix bundle protein [Sandaracinobacteroides sayramensis]MCG2841387.1 ClbS/DfsB family four-helix bundle protein [Sandaracinobacteroides sayramensis]